MSAPGREWRAPGRGLRSLAAAVLGGCAALALTAAPALAAKRPWPPIPKRGTVFIHYGEEHWNDPDGLRILPAVIRDSARYRPDLVTMSADKDDNGTVESLARWKELMALYDRRGIPYFAAVGNHDRDAGEVFIEGTNPLGDLTNYIQVFADRPYPMGDAPPPSDRRFRPRQRPGSDPPGASSHYAFDYGPARWIFLDNSCFGITNCDSLQSPPFPDAEGNQGQYDFLAAEAAGAEGKLVFVVMHMPTRDPRPAHTEPTPSAHIMGEGISPDNALFEEEAVASGVDAVLTGHIKGQWEYEAGGIPYYIDGGAGGEVYAGPGEEPGVDTGYWHGYRLIRVRRGRVRTDTVPVFNERGITIEGPEALAPGEVGEFTAVGDQPTVEGTEVDLELREPDPSAPNARNLPSPARIWTTGERRVLSPVPAEDDDSRRDEARQTTSGRFRAHCPGETRVRVNSGWYSESLRVRVVGSRGKQPANC